MTQAEDDGCGPRREQARQAFGAFYTEHRSLALVVLRVILSGSGIDPDDVASRMWMRIWAQWRERQPLVEAPKAFVRQCARNAAADALRERTDLLLDADELDSLAVARSTTGHPPVCDHPLCPAGEILTDPRLKAAVQELTPAERLVILTSIESYPPPTSDEIAKTLKIASASTVRGHRMRAVKKLRDIFEAPITESGE